MKLPTLYKQSNTGAIQQWTISVEQDDENIADGIFIPVGRILTVYGQVGGQLQKTSDTVTDGKNVGKKNETSLKPSPLGTRRLRPATSRISRRPRAPRTPSVPSSPCSRTSTRIT
jgi:hypothetical protein